LDDTGSRVFTTSTATIANDVEVAVLAANTAAPEAASTSAKGTK